MTQQKKLLLVSNNPHKLEEIRGLLPARFLLLGLSDISWTREIPEPYFTYEDNARAKVSCLFQHTGLPCFADDSGLEVIALDGRPGVRSARFAGDHHRSTDHLQKVLEELGDTPDRSAKFVAVIAYQRTPHQVHFFRGIVEGSIALHAAGIGGFGYDPIFIPSGFEQTFGQLSPLIKKNISHRAKAMRQFIDFIS
jgi:XTP/dITP diphosphohydrolase